MLSGANSHKRNEFSIRMVVLKALGVSVLLQKQAFLAKRLIISILKKMKY
jgi:hypothetical protein